MPVRYALYSNHLTDDPNDFMASARTVASADTEQIVERMIERGSTVGRADIVAVIEDAIGATESLLIDGMRVNFAGMVQLYPRIRGVFEGPDDTFDPSRHRIDVAANVGSRVRRTVRSNASVQKQETVKPAPNPVEFFDVASGSPNDTATPGNIGQLTGNRLGFLAGGDGEGVFFVPTDGGESVRVESIQRNKPSQIVFLVPPLPPGDYRLEVRARTVPDAELRSGTLDAVLTVE
jgi:hypothetical protein